MNKKKILFFGTPEIANPSLEKIVSLENYEIVGVAVFPDRKVGRKQLLTPCPVKKRALEFNLKIIEIANKEELVELHNNFDFDLGIVIAYGLIFPQEILETGKYVNVHFSLLPLYRGASPVQSAILNNELESGITWQRMVYELDAGNILWQKKYSIESKKTSELWSDFSQKTADNFELFLDNYFENKIDDLKQDENLASFCGKFVKDDALINFKKDSAKKIYNKYRAFDVWPGIFVETKKGRVKLLDLALNNIDLDNSYIGVKCANDSEIFVKKVQLSGKKPVEMSDFIRNYSDIFE